MNCTFNSKPILLLVVVITVVNAVPQVVTPEMLSSKPSTFSDVDVTRISGPGMLVKTVADLVCSINMSADELSRRSRFGTAAEVEFFDKQIAAATKNGPLQKALECQKNRNRIMKDTCELQYAIKTKYQCSIDSNTRQVANNIAAVDFTCPYANAGLFMNVTGINEPGPLFIEDCVSIK